MADYPRHPTVPPEHTPTPIEGVPFHFQRPDHSGPIDISRLRMPLMMVIAGGAFVLGTLVSVAGAWFTVSSHTSNRIIHLDEQAVTQGGGPAMKNDLAALDNKFKWQLFDAQKSTRKMLRHAKITCHKAGSGMACDVEVPDDE